MLGVTKPVALDAAPAGDSGVSEEGALGPTPAPQAQPPARVAHAPFTLDKTGLLGHIAWLMTQSPPHRHMFITDLEWLVIPALMLDQFRIWHEMDKEGKRIPSAFASWALLDEEAEARLKGGIKKLRVLDWRSGDRLWLIDVIAPFGGADKAVAQLRESVFKGRTIKSLGPAPDGKGFAVMEW